MKRDLINWLCLSGVICVLFYFAHDIIGAMAYPGYNWMSQAVSDLTACDSPSYIISNGYVTIYSILSSICCVLVSILVKNENKILKIGIYLFTIMNFISSMGYALFPLTHAGYDFTIQSFIHVYIITSSVVLLSVISLIFIIYGSLKNNSHKILGILALLTLIMMFLGAVGSGVVSHELFGVAERFSTYSAVVFTAILGLFGFKIDNNM